METKPVKFRRRTLSSTALLAGAGMTVSCGRNSSTRWRYFTDDEASTVEAITAQLIPAGSRPGRETSRRCRLHRHPVEHALQEAPQAYREGLAGIDATSRSIFGKRFVGLDRGGNR